MLGDPIQAFLQAAQAKNQNRENMYQNIAGIGQGLGQGLASIGDIIGAAKKKQIMDQISQAMATQGAPNQGPALPGQGMMKGMPAPASGIGGPANDNSQLLKSLLMKADPQGAMSAMEGSMFPTPMNPLQQSEIAKNQAESAYYKTKPSEEAAKLEEKKTQDEYRKMEKQTEDQMRQLQIQMTALMAQGRIDEAREAAAQRAELGKMLLQQKVDAFKGQHWVANLMPWSATSKMRGPYDMTAGAGWSDADEKRLQELQKKSGS